MVDILDIFHALIVEFKKAMPNSKHYVGSITEKFKTPCFLYLLVFNKDTRSSYFTKDTMVDLQVIYFGSQDKYGGSSFEDRLQTIHKLKVFLSRFNLQVKDRNLNFDYSFEEVDEQLTVNIQFKFKDGLVNMNYDEEQAREMIERIFINEEEVI